MPEIFETRVLYQPEREELRYLPEGPYPCRDGLLSWVAIQHGGSAASGSLNLLDLNLGKNTSHDLPGRPGFAFPTSQPDVFLIGCEKTAGFYHLRDRAFQGATIEVESAVEGTIINDGHIHEDFVIFGTKDVKVSSPKAGLYFWRPSTNQFNTLAANQTCSNGKAIVHRDGETYLLDIDTPTKRVVEYPLNVQEGTAGQPRTVLDLNDVEAFPDGMILSPDNQSAIIAMYNPYDADFGEARMYGLASGQLQAVWRTAHSPRATCPQWVSLNGAVKLVLTTAVEGMPDEMRAKYVQAGALFIGDTPFESAADAPVFEV